MKQQSKIDVLISRAKTITDADPTAKSLNTLSSVLFAINVVLAVAALISGISYFAIAAMQNMTVDQTTVIVLICCVCGAALLFLFGYVVKLLVKSLAYLVQYTSESAIASRLQAEAVIYELKRRELQEQYEQEPEFTVKI